MAKRSRPPTPIASLAAVLILLAIALSLRHAIGASVAILLIAFAVVRGWRFGYQGGFLLALLLAIFGVAAMFFNDPVAPRLMGAAMCVLALLTVLVLRTNASHIWFHLVCPICGAHGLQSTNFLFTRACCRACGAIVDSRSSPWVKDLLSEEDKFWKYTYPKFSFDEKVRHWSGSLFRKMRWNGESGLDPYAIFNSDWYSSVKKTEPDFDKIIDEVFARYWKDVWSKEEYLLRISIDM